MTLRRRAGSGRGRREGGAALVEAAVVMPLIMLVTFAVIEFALLFSTQSTSLSSIQAGARIGASAIPVSVSTAAFDTMRDDVLDSLDALSGRATPQDLWIFRADADGAPVGAPDFASCTIDCLRYAWNGSTFVHQSGDWSDPDACIFDGDGLDVVGVYITVDHRLITGFPFESRFLTERTSSQLEPLPQGEC